MRGAHERRTRADGRVRQAYAVVRGAEADLLLEAVGCSEHRMARTVDLLLDRSDELIAASVHRLDGALLASGIAHGATRRLDAAGERRLGDEPIPPDRVEQLGLGNDTITIGDEMDEHVEDLGLDVHRRVGAPELVARRVDHRVAESVAHRTSLA